MEKNELYHYGVKGMKWGVRKDRVKSAGHVISKKAKKLAADFNAKRKARRVQEDIRKREQKIMKTPVKKLTTAELQERSRILAARKQALDLERSCKQASNDTLNAGKAFIKKLGTDMLVPAVLGAGKSVLNDYFVKIGKNKLGLNDSDALSALKKEAESWELKGKIASGKMKNKAWEDSQNKTNTKKSDNEDPDPKKSPSSDGNDDSAKTSSSSAKGTGETAKPNTSTSYSDSKATRMKDEDVDIMTPGSNKWVNYSDYVNKPVDDTSTALVTTGRSYVNNLLLLEDKNR